MTTNGLPTDRGPDLREIADAMDEVLLGGPRRHTLDEAAALVGIDRRHAEQLWRSMGFASVPDDEQVFTDGDVEALRLSGDWRHVTGDDEDMVVAMTRTTGQLFAQLAAWEGQLALDNFVAELQTAGSSSAVTEFTERLLPLLERTHAYIWRRQLAACIARRVALAQERMLRTEDAVVGFVDISGYTELSRTASERELQRLIDVFESLATNVVGDHGGRVVKMIGDAAFFVAERAADGADIALDMLAAWPDTEPPLRAGVALGPVVHRLGDVFGSTVNIASRLTSISPPGEALVDGNLAEALASSGDYALEQRPAAKVRGYDRLPSWILQRSASTPARTD